MGKKMKYILTISSVIILIIIGFYIYKSNYHFVPDTDLDKEQIGRIQLEDSNLKNLLSTIQDEFKTVNGSPYHNTVSSDTFTLGADQNGKIEYILSKSEDFHTTKGIKVGDSVEEVILKYGKNYIQGKEMGIGDYTMYVDRASNKLLRFWHHNEKVIQIEYQYLK